MKIPFHYEVRITGFRYTSNDDITFNKTIKVFKDENPLLSRKLSLDFYEEYLSVVLSNLGFSYSNDLETRRILEKHMEKSSTKQILVHGIDDSTLNIILLGVGVFLVRDYEFDKPPFIIEDVRTGKNKEIKVENDFYNFLIHGIGNTGYTSRTLPMSLLIGLENEVDEYFSHNYDLKGLTQTVRFFDTKRKETESYTIIPTPFDWSKCVNPREINKNEIPIIETIPKPIIVDILKSGESDQVEFKPTLIYNFKTQKIDPEIRSIISKTINGFLNSRGGFLFIGVSDDGRPKGLDNDFSLSRGKKHKDFFLLQFDQTIETHLPQWIQNNLNVEFVDVGGIEVFVVFVHPSESEPVFFKCQKGKEFYIRRMGSTKQLDVEDFLYYWKNHWG